MGRHYRPFDLLQCQRMIEAPPPPDEADRIRALRGLGVLDTPPEERFDRITRIAATVFGVPIALVSLVDVNRQWFKSCVGLAGPELPRGISFCAHALLEDDLLVVEDAAADDRFAGNPLVATPPRIRFYAGQVLRGPSGHKLGTLCVIGDAARTFSEHERAILADLGAWAEQELAHVELSAAHHALHQARRRSELLLDTVAEGIVGLAGDGTISFANPAAGAMLLRDPEALVGSNVDAAMPRMSLDGARAHFTAEQLEAVLASPAPVRLERRVWRADGSVFPAEIVIAGATGDLTIAAVVLVRDLTERYEIDRMKDEFASVVGHELRTPLTSIRGSLGLLAGGVAGDLPDEAQRMLSIAIANTDRLVRLVNDILDLERIESGRIDLELEPIPATELLAATVDVIGAMADAAGVELRIEGDASVLLGDRDRLVRALTNLAGNAVKFSPRDAEVVLAARPEGRHVRLEVRDRGRGIPADKIDRIFERFEQVDPSDARDKGGTGLGLAIARSIAEAHGGTIEVGSEVGTGSTFSMVLPAGRGAAHRSSPGDDAPDVLVIEDDADLADVIRSVVERHGARATVAHNAARAVALATERRPDAIVLDVMLPGDDGFRVIERLRTAGAEIPVLVYSALDLGTAERARLTLGPTRFLTKAGGAPEQLEEEIRTMLGRRG